MEEARVLEGVGLGQSEAKAYIASLETGPATNGEIAKSAGLNRSNCNEALKRLVEKGLVSYVIKANKKYYEATDPRHLLEMLKEKEKGLEEIIPGLEEKRAMLRKEQEANIYEGYKGIKSVFEDILNGLEPGEEYLVLGAVAIPKSFEVYIKHWTRRRIEKKINLRIIYNEEARTLIRHYKKERLTEIKVLPKEYITPAVINIYGDKTTTIIWSKEPIAFVVKNKDYTDSFRQYFRLIWGVAKEPNS